MPKRMLDSSLLTSPSLAALTPRAQDAFHRFILLADDFGCLEAAPRVLVGTGWVYRPDVTEQDVAGWLDEYECAGMLERWEENGRSWAFLTGWHGPHGQRRREEYDPKGTPAQKRGSKRKVTPPSERKTRDSHSRGGPAAAPAAAPAPAVPDPDPDPVAARATRGGPAAGSPAVPPTLAPATAPRWPLGEQLRRALSDGLGGQQNGGKGLTPLSVVAEADELERILTRTGVEAAAQVCLERARRNGSGGISSMRYFRAIVLELAAPARTPAGSQSTARSEPQLGPFATPRH